MLKSKFSSEQPDLAVSFGSSGKLKSIFSQENEQNLTAGFQSSGRLKSSFNKTTDLETILKLLKQCYAKIYQDTEENWNIQVDMIAERNAIYVYTNHSYLDDGNGNLTPVPAIKIGDGTSYLIDMAFVGGEALSDWASHVNNNLIHVSEDDRTFWNHKVSSFVDDNDDETLVLSKTLFKLEDIY